MPAPLSVPVPGLPLAATVPDSPPIIPVLVPFLVTSSAVPGAMTGADVDVVGVDVGTGPGDEVVLGAGVVVTVLRSLQLPSAITAKEATSGITSAARIDLVKHI